MSSLRNFLFRFPRFDTDSRVDFILGEAVFLGTCFEISESGLRCKFSVPLLPGSEGLITLYEDGRSYSAHASILDVHEGVATASFQFASEQELNAVRQFIKLLSPS